MVRLQTIFKSNDGSIVAVLDPTTAITCIARHSFECIGNRLYVILHLQAIADFNVQTNEEAEELKACRSEVHDNGAIDHQREDPVVAVQWDSLYFVRRRKHCTGATISRNLQAVKKGDYFFS
jgi:hypothetical protein